MGNNANADFEARLIAWAQTQIAPSRLKHVQGVVATAEQFAQRYAPEALPALRIAAWLHDVARHWPPEQLLAYAEAHALPITASERAEPMLLHGAVGYALAAEHFQWHDVVVQSACQFHTVGDVAMSVTDKILFVADMLEPGRKFSEVEALRAVEREQGLDAALLMGIDLSLQWLIQRHAPIDERQVQLRNKLLEAGRSDETPYAGDRA